MIRESFLDRITSQPNQLFSEIKKLPLVRMYLAASCQSNQEPGLLPILKPYLGPTCRSTHLHKLHWINKPTFSMEFYDFFIQPIEVLFSIGMPLHQLLCKESSSYPCRLELFKETLDLSGHLFESLVRLGQSKSAECHDSGT